MLLVGLMSITIALVLTPAIRALAWRVGAVSWPDNGRNRHVRPTALWGGIAVHGALLLSLAVYCSTAPNSINALWLPVGLGWSGTMLCLLGCWDDLRALSAPWKLLGQIVAILPTVLWGCCAERVVLFGYSVELGWLSVPATVGWLVLGTNALNLLDGMDGLASVTVILISAAVAVIAGGQGHFEVMLLALALAGALAGFLVFNLPPARVYLGDAGSLLIGFLLSLLVLQVSLDGPMTANVGVAAVLLFVPLLDTGLAVVRRTLRGCSFLVADRGHIHHGLLDQGYGIWQVLGMIGGFCLITAIIAWLMAVLGWELLGWAVLASIVAVAVNRQLVGHVEWRLARQFLARTAARWQWRASREERLPPIAPQSRLRGDDPAPSAARHAPPLKGVHEWADRLPLEAPDAPFRTEPNAPVDKPKKAA